MKAPWNGLLILSAATLLAAGIAGCGNNSEEISPTGDNRDAPASDKGHDANPVVTARAKLGVAEQKAVEAQEFCPVSDKRLGVMGTPAKLEVGGDSVFLCCAGCREAAKADPHDTKAKVEELRLIQEQRSKLETEDRKLAAAQVFCVVMDESKLGSMGVPIKVMVEDQPVFVCCRGCVRQAQMNPKQTLAKRAELLRKKF